MKEKLDKNIIGQLKQEAASFEIKTSAQDILNQYAQRKEEKITYRRKIRFSLVAPVVMGLLLIVLIVQLNINSENPVVEDRQIQLNDKTGLGKVAIQLFSGYEMLDLNGTPMVARFGKRDMVKQDFENVVTAFEEGYYLVDFVFLKQLEIKTTLERGDFKIANENFSRKISISSNKIVLYLNMDLEDPKNENSEGYIEVENKQFRIQIEKEYDLEDQEIEVALELNINDNEYIKIKSESATLEYGYSYEFYQNAQKVKSVSIEYEMDEDEVECELEIFLNNTDYEFDILYSNQIFNIEYEFDEFDGSMILTIFDSYREYKEKNQNFIIKIQ